MEEKCREPLPLVQTDAALMFGSKSVSCYLVSVTSDEFWAAVPEVERYEGDPKLTLVMKDGVYSVRLALQEPHEGGYAYRLVRLKAEDPPHNDRARKPRSTKSVIRYGTTSLIAASLSFCIGMPIISGGTLLAQRQNSGNGAGWMPAAAKGSTKSASDNSSNQVLAATEGERSIAREKDSDQRTFSVSMISPPTVSVSSTLTQGDGRDESPTTEKSRDTAASRSRLRPSATKEVSLKKLLEDGQCGRMQSLSKTIAPWLFGSVLSEEHESIRLSDAARSDLKAYGASLQSLNRRQSAAAISSLRDTLAIANANHPGAKAVSSVPGVFVIHSDVANVYFKSARGRLELVRILPIDFLQDE